MSYISYSSELEGSLHMAFIVARQQRHEFITVQHLLLALLDNPSAAEVLKACAANIDDLRKSLTAYIKENTPTAVGNDEINISQTIGFDNVLHGAILLAGTRPNKKEVTGTDVLVVIFGEKDSHAVHLLNQHGVTRNHVIAHSIKKSEPPEVAKSSMGGVQLAQWPWPPKIV